RWAGGFGLLYRGLWQPDRAPARLRARHAVWTLEPIQRLSGRDRASRRRDRLCRIDRPVDRCAPALRNSRQREINQPVAAPHATRQALITSKIVGSVPALAGRTTA